MEYTHLGRTGLTVSRLCLGTMNFGPETDRARLARDHGPGARARHQLLRHGQRLRLRKRARARPRRSSAAGSPRAAAGARRPCSPPSSTATWATGRTRASSRRCNIRRACDASAAAPADRLHRPLPDAPRRPGHAVGRDLAGDGGPARSRARSSTSARRTSPAGTSPRRRRPRSAGTSSGWSASSRIYNLVDARRRARGAAGRAGTTASASSRGRRCTAGCSAASLRKEREGSRRNAGRSARRRSRRTAPQLEAYEDLCDELGEEPAHVALAWLLHPPGGDRRRSSARARSSSSTARCGRSSSTLDDKVLARLDEIFPGHRTAPEDYAW